MRKTQLVIHMIEEYFRRKQLLRNEKIDIPVEMPNPKPKAARTGMRTKVKRKPNVKVSRDDQAMKSVSEIGNKFKFKQS